MFIVIGQGATVTHRMLHESKLFNQWMAQHGDSEVSTLTVNAAYVQNGEVKELHVTVNNRELGKGSQFIIRTPTVDVLTLATDDTNEYLLFVEQHREAIGETVISNVAGGCDWGESPLQAAAREVNEELDLQIEVQAISLLCAKPLLVSPGSTTEVSYMTMATIRLTPTELSRFVKQMHGKHAGLHDEGEHTIVYVVPASQARSFIDGQDFPDLKAQHSLKLAGL